jgi:UDP-N-acetylglucosamine--N-acetylmuramyl-(pentapeptide) pyrophosphoryl-undecaprenol N-acetylglucosamine transferase
MKRILVAGGGSGGHVTPVVSVLHELKDRHPNLEIRYWCDEHFAPQAQSIISEFDPNLRIETVMAGKFRRYQNMSKLQHLLTPSVIFPNTRDAFLVLLGIGQSLFRLLFWRPDVVFTKGGYVCLPIGIAAWILRIPLVIHDSDAHPGMTNRALAPLAKRIATGVPLEHYSYPASKAVYVGIPIDPIYRRIDSEDKSKLKKKLGFDSARPLTVFTGGGLGSQQINMAVATHLKELLEFTNVLLLSGANNYDELRTLTPLDDPRFMLKSFLPGLHEVFGAADVVVSRAGATALLELAALGTPTIIVPSKRLLWQVKHAQVFADRRAVLVLDEATFENPGDQSLVEVLKKVVTSKSIRDELSKRLHAMARPHAASDMAAMIERVARKRR